MGITLSKNIGFLKDTYRLKDVSHKCMAQSKKIKSKFKYAQKYMLKNFPITDFFYLATLSCKNKSTSIYNDGTILVPTVENVNYVEIDTLNPLYNFTIIDDNLYIKLCLAKKFTLEFKFNLSELNHKDYPDISPMNDDPVDPPPSIAIPNFYILIDIIIQSLYKYYK